MQIDETSHIHHHKLKKFVRNILSAVKLNLTYSVAPGVSIMGLNLFCDARPGPIKYRSSYALDYALRLKPEDVLDVGSGGGYHAKQFVTHGSNVLCIDYGTSVYARSSGVQGLEVIHADFNEFESPRKFALVWASHILEHQRNPGRFLEKLIACCRDNGTVCVTVPDPHRNLWGGHVSMWTPGLLAYHVVLCGIDLTTATFVRGSNEFSLFFVPKKAALPNDLTYDAGDLDKLAKFLPQGLCENSDPWKISYDRS